MLGGILVRYVCLVEYWYGMYAWWNTGTVCMLGGILVRYVCFGGFFFFKHQPVYQMCIVLRVILN